MRVRSDRPSPPRPSSPPITRDTSAGAVSGWFGDLATACAKTLVLFAVSAVLVALGLRTASPLVSVDFSDPRRLVDSLTGLVLQLSSIHEYVLLGGGAGFAALAIVVGMLWLRTGEADSSARASIWKLATREVCDRQTTMLLLGAALIALVAFGYQKALWTSILRVPAGALGIGIVSDAEASALVGDLQAGLEGYGAAEFALRPLPVRLDYRQVERVDDVAIDLGRRIGARAVLLHQPPMSGQAGGSATATALTTPLEPVRVTIVFTDPDARFAFDDRLAARQPLGQLGLAAPLTTTPGEKPSVAAPEFRSAGDDLRPLLAAAMGVVLYEDGNYPDAIELLEKARRDTRAPDLQSRGLIDFYLGSAYAENAQYEAAVEAYDRAAVWYEARQANGRLGIQDELVLVKTYLARGGIEAGARRWSAAIEWYEKGLGSLSNDLHDGQRSLARPEEVYLTYARLYGLLANAERRLGNDDEAERRLEAGRDEAEAFASSLGADADIELRLELSRAFVSLGDCGPALDILDAALGEHPENATARLEAAAVASSIGRTDLANAHLVAATEPTLERQSIAAWRARAAHEFWRGVNLNVLNPGLIDSEGSVETFDFLEPDYLDRAEASYRHIIAEFDPTDPDAHRSLAAIAGWRAEALLTDQTAMAMADEPSIAKSSRWVTRPGVWQTAADHYGQAIAETLDVTTSYDPGRASDWLNLAYQYSRRQNLMFSAHLAPDVDAAMLADLEARILADGQEVRTWADLVLAADSPATLEQRLAAMTNVLATIQRERNWYRAFPWNEEEVTARENEFRGRLEAARGLVGSSPQTADGIQGAAYLADFESWFARVVERDESAAAQAGARYTELMNQQSELDRGDIRHWGAWCETSRLGSQGTSLLYRDEAAGGPDIEGARAVFAAGLDLEPEDLELLIHASWSAYLAGDLDEAIALGERAVATDADSPVALWNLALFQRAADRPWEDALDRFLAVAASLPNQERIQTMRMAIIDLADSHDRALMDDAKLLELARRLEAELPRIESRGQDAYQYSGLYGALGLFALYAGAPEDAERLLRQRLALDGQQPRARMWLAVAVAAQGRDMRRELDELLVDLYDPVWREPAVTPAYWYGALIDDLDTVIPPSVADPEVFETIRQALEAQAIEGATFRHPAYDYSVTWNASWPEAFGLIETDGWDLVLQDSRSAMWFRSSDIDRGDPQSCLKRVLDLNAQGDDIAASPDQLASSKSVSDNGGMVVSSLTELEAPAGARSRVHIQCRTLVPGEATLEVWHTVWDADDYFELSRERERVLDQLTMPD